MDSVRFGFTLGHKVNLSAKQTWRVWEAGYQMGSTAPVTSLCRSLPNGRNGGFLFIFVKCTLSVKSREKAKPEFPNVSALHRWACPPQSAPEEETP